MTAPAGMVIIGGGECGARAALALRERDCAGPVTLIGREPHLPYKRPPLSKEVLTAGEEPVPKAVATAERLTSAGISVVTGNGAVAIDRKARSVTLADGATLSYDKLLLATGCEPRRLPIAPLLTGRIAYLRTFDEALGLRRLLGSWSHLIVIGGGFIGLEVAASARKRGVTVTVVEALPRVLSRVVPPGIAAVVEARHRAEGVSIVCGVGVERIDEDVASVVVTLTSGESLSADGVLIGIGAVPVVELAEQAGLAVSNGIVVDEFLRTDDGHIYAAGDCCSFPLPVYGGRRVRLESWRNAQDQGSLAARNMLLTNEPISRVPWFWSDQYDLTLQIAGLPDEGIRQVRRELGDGAFIEFHLAQEGRLVAAAGIGRGNAVARDIRLAELLIAKRAKPEPSALSSPATKLKALLAA